MMKRCIFLMTVLFTWALLSAPARAALACEADMVLLDFGMISLRDGFPQQTSGPVTILCAGGAPFTTIQACMKIGSGSGGAGAGQSPRYMTRDGTAPLSYQLTAQNFFSSGGPAWETVGYAVPLNANGSATITSTLYAEVTSIGALSTTGHYISNFASGSDTRLSFGLEKCDRSGAASAFTVSADVTTSCMISVSNMDFGLINTAIITPIDQTSIIEVSCTNASPYTISIDSGLNPMGAGPMARRMVNGTNLLAYGLYHNLSRTSDWGIMPATVAAGTGTGRPQALTVYGRIFGNQSTSIGSYSDSVIVTVSY
jgi:spore coat protein U-like protein